MALFLGVTAQELKRYARKAGTANRHLADMAGRLFLSKMARLVVPGSRRRVAVGVRAGVGVRAAALAVVAVAASAGPIFCSPENGGQAAPHRKHRLDGGCAVKS